MATRPKRVPADVHQEVHAASRLLGRSPAELLESAWRSYRESPQLRGDFELAQKAFAAGDLETITQLLAEKSRARAQRRAARVRELRSS